ncbi:MAG: methionine synthase, partial [Acidobacteria bacterium]
PDAALEPLLRGWRELGLDPRGLAGVAVTPACGLAGATPEQARALTAATVTTAARLAEVAG